MDNKEAIRILELERDDWETLHCSPSVRKDAFNTGIKAIEDSIPKFHLQCLMCGGEVGSYSKQTMEQVSYTHYSYCEDCLRKGLKALKEQRVKTGDVIPRWEAIEKAKALIKHVEDFIEDIETIDIVEGE